MFVDTITVYNKYTDINTGTEKWARTVLEGVYWNAIKGATVRRTGVTSADSVQLIIPFAADKGHGYTTPKVWAALGNRNGRWTLQSGDIILHGDTGPALPYTAKELQGYDDMLVITSVDTKAHGGLMAHWEVSGK